MPRGHPFATKEQRLAWLKKHRCVPKNRAEHIIAFQKLKEAGLVSKTTFVWDVKLGDNY